jgi:hypothetical protein
MRTLHLLLVFALGGCGGRTAHREETHAEPAAAAPSTRLTAPPADGIAILDLANTPANEVRVVGVLSAAGIPFHLAPQPPTGWATESVRYALTVSRADLSRVESLLKSEIDAGRLTVVQGTSDLIGRY